MIVYSIKLHYVLFMNYTKQNGIKMLLESIIFNGYVNSINPATGNEK